MDEIETLMADLDSIFIGHFTDRMNIEFATYESCASSPKEKSLYVAIINPKVEKPKVEYRNFVEDYRDKFSGEWDWGQMSRWMSNVQAPFIDEITSDNAERFVKSKNPYGYIIYDGRTDDTNNMKKIGTSIGKEFRKRMTPVLLDHSKHSKVFNTLGLDATQLPGFTIVAPFPSYDEEAKAHYPLLIGTPQNSTGNPLVVVDEEWKTRKSTIDTAAISHHIDAFLRNELPLRIRSEPASLTEEALRANELMVPVTGSTFNRTVLDMEKNVLVLFTAPWCSKCKRLRTQLESLAREIHNY